MNSHREPHDRTLVINISLTRGAMAVLAVAVVAAALFGYLAWGQTTASASAQGVSPATSAAATGGRRYYLTEDIYNGDQADGGDICASGFHFASIWEIVDPSSLVYDTSHGKARPDSGSGPPTSFSSWVRTGYNPGTGTTIGTANCSAWSGASPADYGTSVMLPDSWNTSAYIVHVWIANTDTCNTLLPVWCVED